MTRAQTGSDFVGPGGDSRAARPREQRSGCLTIPTARAAGTHRTYPPLVARQNQTHFGDAFANLSSGWPTIDDASYWAGYRDGAYQFLTRTAMYTLGVTAGVRAREYRIDLDGRIANNGHGYIGISFDISDDWSEYAMFLVSPSDGTDVVFRRSSGVCQDPSGHSLGVERQDTVAPALE